MNSNYFSAHTHSHFSTLDGMTKVENLVSKAVLLGHPAMGLADHGNMAGSVRLYKACKREGILPYPGIEGYLIDPDYEGDPFSPAKGTKVGRYHFGLLALNEDGYKALVRFSSLTHTRPRFNRFPRTLLTDLATLGAEHGEDLAMMTGCYFGLVQQTLVREGAERARKRIAMLQNWFPNLFVELQHHNIDHAGDEGVLSHFETDDDIVESLYLIAGELGLPVIATQDSHYTDQREKKAHALMKRMTYGGVDDEFPGDSFHLASSEWVAEHYREEIWSDVEDGFEHLLSLNSLAIKPLDAFVPDIPKMKGDAETLVRKAAKKALRKYLKSSVGAKHHAKYEARLEYEFDIIGKQNMFPYFLIWKRFVDWCRDEGIGIEARGSGNGSLVNLLLGITQVDPIRWDIGFERFMSLDRIKPPDIDMDIEDVHRPRAVDYLISLYGGFHIGTWGALGSTYDEREDKETGSVLVSYLSSKRRECLAYAESKMAREGKNKGEARAYATAMFNNMYGSVKDLRDVEAVNARDYAALREMSQMAVYRSYGVHAGGVLLPGRRFNLDDYVPTMLVASSNTRVSQYDQDDVEEFGLLKMDILGQASLRTMKTTQELIGRDDPTDFSWIPDDDPKACKILREGVMHNGIFHFEAYTKSRGGKEMGIRTTKDAVLASALYMPGAMESGQTTHYIRARRDPDYRRQVDYIHPIFERHLKDTYGAYVYQNQVMSILHDMGMDIASINMFLKVVKDSGAGARARNAERLANLKATYDALWKKNGIEPEQRDDIWDALCGFGAYGFNKAHAAGYGIRSYRMAYLKAYYPLEFMTALLQTWAGRDKEVLYVREARRMDIRLMPPHVNISGKSWSIDRKKGAIRKGLMSIDGIGEATAAAIAEQAPYKSIREMVETLPGRVMTGGKDFLATGAIGGNIKKLDDAGALTGLDREHTGSEPLF